MIHLNSILNISGNDVVFCPWKDELAEIWNQECIKLQKNFKEPTHLALTKIQIKGLYCWKRISEIIPNPKILNGGKYIDSLFSIYLFFELKK